MLLGDDLLDRPRHGRIRLRGKWIHFPLRAKDLLLRLDRKFALGSAFDMLTGKFRKQSPSLPTFASVLEKSLGKTICDSFYFPYARKIWGREPEELSALQATRRVSAASFTKLVRKIFPKGGSAGGKARRFFYPRRGYGQITEAYAEAAKSLGAAFLMNTEVTSIKRASGSATRGWSISAKSAGSSLNFEADYVWSTIPVTLLPRLIDPAPDEKIADAAAAMQYRAMLLVYLELGVGRFTEYDAHYFPGADIAITRLSEPKNYSDNSLPEGRTTLCAELPCAPDDHLWDSTDGELGLLVARDLERAGIPLPAQPLSVHVKRLRHAYPIYLNGHEVPLTVLDRWVSGIPDLLTYGRQGLFAHDNTHHAQFMAYSAVDCLVDGEFDTAKWEDYRQVFAKHVVED